MPTTPPSFDDIDLGELAAVVVVVANTTPTTTTLHYTHTHTVVEEVDDDVSLFLNVFTARGLYRQRRAGGLD